MKKTVLALSVCMSLFSILYAADGELNKAIDTQAGQLEKKIIEWRRHLHANPELSNREFKTAEMIAAHLKQLGLEVKTGVAHTGVVGLLRGGKPGPVVALRADMDALPVTERTPVPFASKVRAEYNGQEVGVMHACGHDTHVAILMGVAELMSGLRAELPGSIKFIFQPAEEGAPAGERGGARLMVEEGVLENPKVDAIFGLHIMSKLPAGHIAYRPGGFLAASDVFTITVKGKQTHGSTPWQGVDPIVTAAQIITGLQTIISRQTELTQDAAVITVGKIQGGVRSNIIPEEVELVGTIRTLQTAMQDKIHEKIRLTATKIAESAGAEAEVVIRKGYPVTHNDPDLTGRMLPTLQAVAGADNVHLIPAITGAEDFSFYQKKVPGVFFFLGGMPPDMSPEQAAPHHTPDFYIDESGLVLGVRALARMAVDYMTATGR
ncbi:MAG TPA: amidohydrolase [Bacteroidetes bacterium]|nr:amidohydrolase [Bacteroidota bacterium]